MPYPFNLNNITKQVIEVAKNAGNFIRNEQGNFSKSDIEEKEKNQFVTYVDKGAEKLIVDGLDDLIKDADFICEEGTAQLQNATYQWIIDPLDGTTNFLHGLPAYSVSIALWHGNKGLLGVVYDVVHNKVYHAHIEGKAYCDGQLIQVSNTTNFEDSLNATGFPYTDFSWSDNYLEFLKHLMKNTRGIRRFGSAALDLVWVAEGKVDVFYEQSLNAWDVAAGIIIAQQAGGKVSDFKGGNDFLHGRNIVASNGYLHQTFLEALQQYV